MPGPASRPALQRVRARRQRGTAPSCRDAAQPPGHLLPPLPSPSHSHALVALPTALLTMAPESWGAAGGRGVGVPLSEKGVACLKIGSTRLAAEAGRPTHSPPSLEEKGQDDVP